MNKAIKAALLSALLFPGSGQFYLKRYGRGLLIMIIIVLGLAIIIVRATISVLDSLNVMAGNGTAFDLDAITRLAETSSANIFTDNAIVFVILVVCWVFSVVDAYIIGKRSLSRPT